jgi:voltage-gated potassium channel Kch
VLFNNSLYVICITYLTVGYGDITPQTQVGRCVAVIAGLSGVLTSSLLAAITHKKLVLNIPEERVSLM